MSSPSTCSWAWGVFASRTKWLSQWGQYSSLLVLACGYSLARAGEYGRVLEFARILAEGLLALFADKGHLKALHQVVVGDLVVALCAVEPFSAWRRQYMGGRDGSRGLGGLTAWRADGDLGVEDVLAAAHQRR